MTPKSRQVWELVRRQHGVISREQLRRLGLTEDGIKHRIAIGRLYRVRRGVFAVGRPSDAPHGRWMAAVVACGDGAVLSHSSAAALWRIGFEQPSVIELSLPSLSHREVPELRIHRRPSLRARDTATEYGIPVTTPIQTLIDMSLRLDRPGVERMINEADKYNLTHPPQLREALDARAGEPGVARLRFILDRRTFRLTREELERRLPPAARP